MEVKIPSPDHKYFHNTYNSDTPAMKTVIARIDMSRTVRKPEPHWQFADLLGLVQPATPAEYTASSPDG